MTPWCCGCGGLPAPGRHSLSVTGVVYAQRPTSAMSKATAVTATTTPALFPHRLPTTLWRVVWLEGYGWPRCVGRRLKQRTYALEADAARMVTAIRKRPDHHMLIAVYTSGVSWEPVTEEVAALAVTIELEVNDADVDES